jgi:UDP-N-acetylmuramoyl-tripeptide--D-alanyl-D-alanine ligase
MAVIEMGANHQKEIAGYCTYALPTHGIITNCGKAHLEGFGGVEGVKKGKGELFDFIRKENGTVFINLDLTYLHEMSLGIQSKITFGSLQGETVGNIIKADPFLCVSVLNTAKGALPELSSIQTQLVGDYNLSNVLLAVSVGIHFGVPPSAIKKALENYQPTNSRSQLIKKGNNTIILDAYNANPSSMQVAIENFSKIQAEKKILMLGSMAELGDESKKEHEQIIDLISKYAFQNIVLVGEQFGQLKHPYIQFSTAKEAAEWYHAQTFENTHFLIKGSRSMKMEIILA